MVRQCQPIGVGDRSFGWTDGTRFGWPDSNLILLIAQATFIYQHSSSHQLRATRTRHSAPVPSDVGVVRRVARQADPRRATLCGRHAALECNVGRQEMESAPAGAIHGMDVSLQQLPSGGLGHQTGSLGLGHRQQWLSKERWTLPAAGAAGYSWIGRITRHVPCPTCIGMRAMTDFF